MTMMSGNLLPIFQGIFKLGSGSAKELHGLSLLLGSRKQSMPQRLKKLVVLKIEESKS